MENEVTVIGKDLRREKTKSCGCLQRELSSKRIVARNTTHGMSKSPTYLTWNSMLQRCTNPNRSKYKDYGGRSIKVCKRWLKFESFYRDMGNRPEGLTLERKDNSKGYFPDNCEWATQKQNNNNKRTNIIIEYKGKKQTIAQWANRIGVKYNTLWARLNRNWPVEKALTI